MADLESITLSRTVPVGVPFPRLEFTLCFMESGVSLPPGVQGFACETSELPRPARPSAFSRCPPRTPPRTCESTPGPRASQSASGRENRGPHSVRRCASPQTSPYEGTSVLKTQVGGRRCDSPPAHHLLRELSSPSPERAGSPAAGGRAGQRTITTLVLREVLMQFAFGICLRINCPADVHPGK